ncbi:MAG: excinuclease ABC subunit UvrC [Oscillospiraceae bacterium]|nr:excinuclease ABC subunit UvrC [Oscillospiraceae bacterium]
METLHEKALGLAALPGVYIMKDKHSRVIYVGKASRLKNRVSSYFSGSHDGKTEKMVSAITDFDVIITDSEFEALVLENSLIKHHVPKYNVKLRDDKGYPFIRVDLRDSYPKFEIVSRPSKDAAQYLGPYSGRAVIREAIGAVSKALMLPTCGKDLKRIMGKERPCLNFHIGTCRGYCQDAKLEDEHRESVMAAIAVFTGKTGALTSQLASEMDEASENLLFEVAAQKRDRLRAVQSLEQKQLVVSGGMADTDVIGFYRGAAKSCFTVMHFIKGKLISKDYEIIDSPIEEDSEAISGAMRQYYGMRGVFPGTILLPVIMPDNTLLEQYFSEMAGRKVVLNTPLRGDKHKLVSNANINARDEVERSTTQEEKTLKTLEWLKHALRIEEIPNRIEAYDISNTSGSDSVAAMSVFVKGKAYKKDFRRFKIKTISGQDDYGSMREVVERRLLRYKNNDGSFGQLPDLLLVDGGFAHASVVSQVLKIADVQLPVFGMVKDDKHKTRALVSPQGEEIGLSGNPAVFALIGNIQEQTHKYALEYHQSLRTKSNTKSKLDGINGVGEKRRNALLKGFGSIKAIGAANMEQLSKIVPANVAKAVYEHFNGAGG